MHLPPLCRLLALAALTAATAQAQTAPAADTPPAEPAPARIEIIGGRASETEERRQSTAAKIVIGREEIEKFGDATLGEVLRRLPGVTTPGAPGRGGAPRLRGLGGGYTQLLIDGQRVPPGFALDQLSPEQVERIEILRAPTAETGARAIAGTINIITREGFRRRLNELRLGTGVENGVASPNLNWLHNDSAGALTYNLSANLGLFRSESESTTETTDEDLASAAVLRRQTETSQASRRRIRLGLNSRLQWRLGDGGDMLLLTPGVFHTESGSSRRSVLRQDIGATPPPYDLAGTEADSRFTSLRLNGQFRKALAAGPRLELDGGIGSWRAAGNSLRQEYAQGQPTPRTLDNDGQTREQAGKLTLKLSGLLGGETRPGAEHNLVAGAEVAGVRREEQRRTLQDGLPLLAEFGDNLSATSLRLAAYAQDEWSPTPTWSLHAGLRWEGIATRGEAVDGPAPENRSSVLTPLLHAVWKPDPKRRDQLRISLTRSYRAPGLGELIARPRINSRFPPEGPNDPTDPDRAGNPALQPELASGVDIAVERYLAGGGVLSANLFRRNISDLMRNVTSLETVSWSPVPRWVTRMQNIGDAMTTGLELEAKFRLDQALASAPAVELRSNLSLYRSRVEGVPEPDNRLAEQPGATLNLGGDYRLRSMPLTLGGNFNWVPGYRTQLSAEQAVSVGPKRIFDVYALWTFDPATALRLLANNLGAADHENSNVFERAGLRETARSFGPSHVNWQLRLELKL